MGKSARHDQNTGLDVTSEPVSHWVSVMRWLTLSSWRQKRTLGCLWGSQPCLTWPFPQSPKATAYFVRESTGIYVCPSVTELNIAKGSRSYVRWTPARSLSRLLNTALELRKTLGAAAGNGESVQVFRSPCLTTTLVGMTGYSQVLDTHSRPLLPEDTSWGLFYLGL